MAAAVRLARRVNADRNGGGHNNAYGSAALRAAASAFAAASSLADIRTFSWATSAG